MVLLVRRCLNSLLDPGKQFGSLGLTWILCFSVGSLILLLLLFQGQSFSLSLAGLAIYSSLLYRSDNLFNFNFNFYHDYCLGILHHGFPQLFSWLLGLQSDSLHLTLNPDLWIYYLMALDVLRYQHNSSHLLYPLPLQIPESFCGYIF